MKKILYFLKDYKKESVIAPLFKMLEAIFELIVPLVVAQIIDIGIKNSDTSYIFQRCGVLILLAIIGLVCATCAQFFAAKAAVGFATKLRSALFAHIQKLSFVDIDEVGTSTLITRMTSDVNQLQSGVNMVLRLFMRSPFVVFGAMIMAFTVNAKAAVVFVVTIPLLSVVVFGVMLYTMPLYKKVQAALDRVLGKTRENLSGVRVIRAFNKEEKEIKAKEKENRKNGVVSTKETEVLDLSHYTDDLDTKKISDQILVEVAKEDISKELKELENGTLEIEEVNEDKE